MTGIVKIFEKFTYYVLKNPKSKVEKESISRQQFLTICVKLEKNYTNW